MPWIIRTLLFVVAPLIAVNWYVGRRLFQALTARWERHAKPIKRTLIVAVVYANLLPLVALVAFWTGGRSAMGAFAGESRIVDILLSYPYWAALIIVVQLFLLFLIWDLVRVLGVYVARMDRVKWRRWTHAYVLVSAVVIAAYSIPRIYLDTATVRVSRVDLDVPAAFSALNGVKILHISDLQGDGRTDSAKIGRFVELCNSLAPDVILNSGDQVTGGELYITSTAELLAGMKAPLGQFAAVGDHDIFSNKSKMLGALRANGTTVFDDTSIVIRIRDVPVWLSFVTYTYPQKPDSLKLNAIFSAPDSTFRILLIHQPAEKIIKRADSAQYHLALAGHTHGGGIAFGIPGIGYIAPATFESPYVSGVYTVGGLTVNVTNGLGFTLAPVRFQAPLDVTLITLRSGK